MKIYSALQSRALEPGPSQVCARAVFITCFLTWFPLAGEEIQDGARLGGGYLRRPGEHRFGGVGEGRPGEQPQGESNAIYAVCYTLICI